LPHQQRRPINIRLHCLLFADCAFVRALDQWLDRCAGGGGYREIDATYDIGLIGSVQNEPIQREVASSVKARCALQHNQQKCIHYSVFGISNTAHTFLMPLHTNHDTYS
jgi:hypothetical protein